ncbi:hypothetical protein MELA_02401 [Candidatus Methylomirabilis lanthanidiphila]|uniref:Uncharacterized protein n=1 Tax=Candidatus Methylomirabilis lanthanidiphila TaxID=2211376 RepID=A0A564ZMC6_9BACT|nr:hypothetical protein [Candidatus Methylomirabilis lanthanidiphila]VUZ86007.1 hypothetical protein MELA_02401 [Candidatus Methylomirabilis lanthanidiphila]
MARMTDFEVVNPLRNMARICRLGLVVGCLGILALSPFPSSAWGGFACEDVNNNGVCDPGVDNDITTALTTDGSFSTSESIVIPTGVSNLVTPQGIDFSLTAGKNITINSNLVAKTANIYMAAGGTITIGVKTSLRAGSYLVMLDARGDIVLHPQTSVLAEQDGTIYLFSQEGSLLLMDKSKLGAKDVVHLQGKGVTVRPGSLFKTESMSVYAEEDMSINGSVLNIGTWLWVETWGHLLDFKNNRVQVTPHESSVYLTAEGSTVNISGTKFKNLDPDDLIIQATDVIQ